MSIVLALALMVAVGLVMDPTSPWRRRAAYALGWLAVAAPLVMGRLLPAEPPLVRFLAGLGAAGALARGWELAREARPRGWRARVFHTTTLFDSRATTPIRPELRAGDGLRATVAYAIAAAGLALAYLGAPAGPPAAHWAVRWLGGLVFLYAMMEGLAAGIPFAYALAGRRVPRLHDHPIAARSLGEFWGERWNRPVSLWLRRACFIPLARRGRGGLGLLWAFTVSALLHMYLVLVAIGARPALVVGGLFVIHGVLLLVENRLGVRRWPPTLGRLWFVVVMVATAPLILEPLLRIVRPGG